MTVLYILLFLLACAAPVLLAVLILKIPKRIITPWWKAEMNEDFKSYFLIISAIFVVPVMLLIVIGSYTTTLFPESAWAYAIQYGTESQYVVIDSMPHDCEFFKAPIGNKYCHFDRTVTTHEGDESVNHKILVYVSWNKVSE